MPPHIAIILPPKEQYSAQQKGAVALCMADFTRHSRYRENTTFLGHTEADFDGLHYHRLQRWQRWYWRDSYAYARTCAKWILRQNISHVEVQNRPVIFRYLAKLLPNHIALTLHLHNDLQEMRWFTSAHAREWVLKRAAAVYCVSDYIRQRLLQGIPDQHGAHGKAVVIHNGIDTQRFVPEDKTHTILYVGRIIREKGTLPLAEALSIIAPLLPYWEFVLCGVDRVTVVSDYERATHAWLAKAGTQCRYTGYLDHNEIMQQFARAAIAVVPSVWQEPFGRTALEALCAGAAVLTSGSGGLAEVVADAGLTVPNNPAESFAQNLANALLKLARNDDFRANLQQAGRRRAIEHFDIRRQAALLDDWRQRIQHDKQGIN